MTAETDDALSPSLSLEQYLRTSFHPDCDFVDDHIEERCAGEFLHGLLQVEVGFWFRLRRDDWRIRTLLGVRTRVSEQRVRIPDVSVVWNDEALRERVRVTPPLIAIEILSSEDQMPRVLVRLNDFLAMGVENVWVFDPQKRVAYTYNGDELKLVRSGRLTVAETPIYVDLAELFSALD